MGPEGTPGDGRSVLKGVDRLERLVTFITPVLRVRYPYRYRNAGLTERRGVNQPRTKDRLEGIPQHQHKNKT